MTGPPRNSALKITAVLTVRNEGAFLIDWLAFHRHIGFSDFLVFSNDCDDGTDAMLTRLQEMGWLTHIPNPGPWEEGPQWAALKQAEKHPLVRKADWVMVIDIDEYLNIHTGDQSLAALIAALPGADAIPVTWRMFGNGGVVDYTDTPITETFTHAAPRVLHWPWRALMVKTLFRPDAFRKLGVHRPKGEKRPARWSDPGLGGRLFSEPGRDPYALAQLNHYALGAMESYIVKCDRGRANRESAAFDMSYWCDRNFASDQDDSIGRVDFSALRRELHEDSQLHQMHEQAVLWRKARFAALMAEEPWRALFGRLLMTPPARILTKEDTVRIRAHRKV